MTHFRRHHFFKSSGAVITRQTDRVVSALQPTWLLGLGRARTRDQPVSRRKGYPDRFRGSPSRSSVDAMLNIIVLSVPCQVVGDVTPTPCAQHSAQSFHLELALSSPTATWRRLATTDAFEAQSAKVLPLQSGQSAHYDSHWKLVSRLLPQKDCIHQGLIIWHCCIPRHDRVPGWPGCLVLPEVSATTASSDSVHRSKRGATVVWHSAR